jgi:hypothetical protein
MHSLIEPASLLLIGSNLASYVLGGGTIHVRIGRVSLKIHLPRHRT